MLSKTAIENLTPEQKHIADFWDDNPFKLNVSGHVMFGSKKFSPGGHWMSIVGIAAKKANSDFATTVYAYAKTSIALFDAFIQCWETKFKYNTIRPESVINRYFDADWKPRLQTPPFPEYTCGHSTCSAAAAEALTTVDQGERGEAFRVLQQRARDLMFFTPIAWFNGAFPTVYTGRWDGQDDPRDIAERMPWSTMTLVG